MRYFDTSFLTPLFIGERTSSEVNRFITDTPAGELATSQWSRVEFSSVLGRLLRMGVIDRQAARRADEELEILIRRSFVLYLPVAEDFDLAKKYLARYETGLRGGDALHLAIASNQDVEAIHTLDKKLLRAGKLLGLPVSDALR